MHENVMFLSHDQTHWVNLIMVYGIDMPLMLMNKLHELQNYNSIAIELNCNFVKTIHFQLLCNSIIIAPMMSC
jgi:hypothetical protein